MMHARVSPPLGPRTHWLLLLLPIAAAAWTRELWAPDEPRYAQVAREIFTEGRGFLVMHLAGEVYPDKPPLLFWLAGLLGWLSSWNVFAMRLVSLAATALMALLVARLARRWWGPLESAWAPVLFLSFFLVTQLGARLQIDPLLAAFCLGALVLASAPAASRAQAGRNVLLAGLCTGLGALAKGPVAFANVGLVLLAWRYLRLERDGARASRAAVAGAAVLALLPVLTWAATAVALEPTLFRDLFFGQHLERAAKGTTHRGPPWQNLVRMPLQLLPWTLPVLAGLLAAWRGWRTRASLAARDEGLLRAAAWLCVLFVFFSVLPAKRDLYLLPAYPAAALLAARWLALALERRAFPRWLGLAMSALALLAGLALIVAGPLSTRPGRLEQLPLPWQAPATGALFLATGVLSWRRLLQGQELLWARVLVRGWAAGMLALALLVLPVIDQVKSPRGMAEALLARPERPAEIPAFGVRPEGYRFYSGLDVVAREARDAERDLPRELERDGRAFLGLLSSPVWEHLDAGLRGRLRILAREQVGGRQVLLVGAAVEHGG